MYHSNFHTKVIILIILNQLKHLPSKALTAQRRGTPLGSHVDFKKGPYRHVEFRGRGPYRRTLGNGKEIWTRIDALTVFLLAFRSRSECCCLFALITGRHGPKCQSLRMVGDGYYKRREECLRTAWTCWVCCWRLCWSDTGFVYCCAL